MVDLEVLSDWIYPYTGTNSVQYKLNSDDDDEEEEDMVAVAVAIFIFNNTLLVKFLLKWMPQNLTNAVFEIKPVCQAQVQ